MIYELVGYNTDSRSGHDVRYRAYTASIVRAEAFKRIPKIQFSDSGHGIVFHATALALGEKRKPCVYVVDSYVNEQLALQRPAKVAMVVAAKSRASKTCPCEYGSPCCEACTCANPARSFGCLRCCRYGSDEQREAAARRIVAEEKRLRAFELVLPVAIEHFAELADAWSRGSLSDCDGQGGTRSNRNFDLLCSLRSAAISPKEIA